MPDETMPIGEQAARRRFEVLHVLRVRGIVTTDSLVDALPDLDDSSIVDQALADIEQRAWARHRSGGRVAGWMLSNEGMSEHAKMLHTLTTEEQVADLLPVYRDFLYPNQRFKTLTASWQADGDVDEADIAQEVGEIHHEVVEVLARASRVISRFGVYERRLTHRLDEYLAGDRSALASPASDSYHDIWMELHEDLLVTLGHTR